MADSGYFIIADISGYTAFIANNDLSHAQGVLSEITELIIERLAAPLKFVELEGDAVFVFAPDEAVEDSERLVEIMEACYAAFRLRVERMVANTSCPCSACRAIPELDLKCVAHFGMYLPQSTPTGTKLVGPDVVLAHRLLKNSVIEATGIKAYALLTEAFLAKAEFGDTGLGLPEHVEEYAELGLVKGRVLNLSAAVERYRQAARRRVSAQECDLELEVDLPAPKSHAWSYLIDPNRRMSWQLDTNRVTNQAAAGGRMAAGAEAHCDHGSYRMNHRIIDFQPIDYITMHTISSGFSLVRPPNSIVTFSLEETDRDHCKLNFRVRIDNRSLLMRGVLEIVKPMFRREWNGHFDVLKRVMQKDVAAQRQGPV